MWERNFLLEKSFSLFSIYVFLGVVWVAFSALAMVDAIENGWSVFAELNPATYLALMAIASLVVLVALFFFIIVLEKRDRLRVKEAEYRLTIFALFLIKFTLEIIICYRYYERFYLVVIAGVILNLLGASMCSCLLEVVKGIKCAINVLQEILKSYR